MMSMLPQMEKDKGDCVLCPRQIPGKEGLGR
jgi:hypothetical protein